MKTLTEFSGMIIRLAAKGLADAKAALPAETPAAPAEAPAASAEAPVEGTPAAVAAAPAPVGESEATKAAFDAAVSAAANVTGDRLQRLREALVAVGSNVADVRVVRVYAGEESVNGAKKVGEHHYIVDLMPQSMKQVSTRPEKKHQGRTDRPAKRGEESLSAPFSMDSLRNDKGGGRRGAGGGKPGGPKP